METFVNGSLWGNFSDDNQAMLVSTGTTFKLDAKVDVTFSDDLDVVGGKAGMRVSWVASHGFFGRPTISKSAS
jgi:hypothetical protein